MAHLFDLLKLRDIALPNRIGMPPMCQYSATDGVAADWHFVHYGSRAVFRQRRDGDSSSNARPVASLLRARIAPL